MTSIGDHPARDLARRACGALLGLWLLTSAAVAAETGPTTAAEAPPPPPERQDERDRMVAVIEQYGFHDPVVLKAMRSVPRHRFVPASMRSEAYADTPLPIGHGQTISQPYIVAEMTRQLELTPTSRVLEIGTGSGYQAAVLAAVTPHVFSVEIIGALAERALLDLREAGCGSVQVRHADGHGGWPEEAPFDAIVVTCAASQIPPPLVRQLAPDGRMVIPVGPPFAVQDLMLVTRDADGTVRSRSLMAVRFVPLVRTE